MIELQDFFRYEGLIGNASEVISLFTSSALPPDAYPPPHMVFPEMGQFVLLKKNKVFVDTDGLGR
jgi:hypothetical protein